jgi:hypothetical protein
MMPIFMFASYGWIAEATGGPRKPMSASSERVIPLGNIWASISTGKTRAVPT